MTDPLYAAHTSTIDSTPSLPTDVEPCGCDHSQLREAQLIDALLASVRAQERAEQYRAECEGLRGELDQARRSSDDWKSKALAANREGWNAQQEAKQVRLELAATRDNGPKHTRECGTAYRGCSPDCTYQADVEALHEKRRPSSTPDAAQPQPDPFRWSINNGVQPVSPDEALGAELTAAIARDEAAEQKADAPKETGWLNPDGSYENRAGTYLEAAYVPEALRVAVAEAARPVNAADMDKVLRRAEKAERELAEVRGRGEALEKAARGLLVCIDGKYAGSFTAFSRSWIDRIRSALTPAQEKDHG